MMGRQPLLDHCTTRTLRSPSLIVAEVKARAILVALIL